MAWPGAAARAKQLIYADAAAVLTNRIYHETESNNRNRCMIFFHQPQL